jgi:hypothetical protein
VVGRGSVSRAAAARMLARHGGSAERAADAFFADGGSGDAGAPAAAPSAAAPRSRPRRRAGAATTRSTRRSWPPWRPPPAPNRPR